MHRQNNSADFKCARAQVDTLPGLEEGTLELLQATLQTQPGVKLHSFALRKSIPELFTLTASLSIPYIGKLNI